MNSKNQKPNAGEPSSSANSPKDHEQNLKTPSDSLLEGFESRFSVWAPQLESQKVELLRVYLGELLRFNKRLNLISPSTAQRADTVHILDAVRAWSLVESRIPKDSVVFDFGSGNGLPGMVAAILSPELVLRLVDRDQRKIEFLKHVGSTLGLRNLIYSCENLQDLEDRSVTYGISRGFASVSTSLLKCRRLFKAGGEFFMLKGEGWSRELAEVQSQIFSDWSAEMVGEYRLPETAADFVVLKAKRLR